MALNYGKPFEPEIKVSSLESITPWYCMARNKSKAWNFDILLEVKITQNINIKLFYREIVFQ